MATTSSRRPAAGPDRFTVAMFALAAFLAVLALLAWQLKTTPLTPVRPAAVVRTAHHTRMVRARPAVSSSAGATYTTSGTSSAPVSPLVTRASGTARIP